MARLYQAKPWDHLRKTKRWLDLRLVILERDLWTCQMPDCGRMLQAGNRNLDGAFRSAVVDHKIPHKGDEGLFFDEVNLWALCKQCHDRRKQLIELHGFDPTIGEDGWPTDPSHPANRSSR